MRFDARAREGQMLALDGDNSHPALAIDYATLRASNSGGYSPIVASPCWLNPGK
jgi:hypothetical protein